MKAFSIWYRREGLPNGKFRKQDRETILNLLSQREDLVVAIEQYASGFFIELDARQAAYESHQEIAEDIDAIGNAVVTLNRVLSSNGSALAIIKGELAALSALDLARRFSDMFGTVDGEVLAIAVGRAKKSMPPKNGRAASGRRPSAERTTRLGLVHKICTVAQEAGIKITRKEGSSGKNKLILLIDAVCSALGIEPDTDNDIRLVKKHL